MLDTTQIEQGTHDWRMARLGKITASKIAAVMAKGKDGKPSLTRAAYLTELACERLTQTPTVTYQSPAMLDGTAREPAARRAYAFQYGVTVEEVGFVPHPTIAESGASPDGLVAGTDGIVQFKCPAPHTHLATIKGAPIDRGYLLQIQWEMEVTGRQWCDFVSFHPDFPIQHQLHVRRVARDNAMIAEITEAVKLALADLAADVAFLEAA